MSIFDPLTNPLGLTVLTDAPDYAPGSTAIFMAANVTVGGVAEFSVAHIDAGADGVVGTADDVLVHDLTGTTAPWIVVDGGAGDLDGVANGVITTSWAVNQDAANQAFVLSVTDSAAGVTASVGFTDSNEPDALGVLQSPTGTDAHTGDFYNKNHWSAVDGDTITATITGATDAHVVGGTVQVLVKSSEHGNTPVTGTFDADGADNIVGTADDNAITFHWTVQSLDGSDICNTTIVAYDTIDAKGHIGFSNTSTPTGAVGGFGVVNADGSHHDDTNGSAPGCGDDVVVTPDPELTVTKTFTTVASHLGDDADNPLDLADDNQVDHDQQEIDYTVVVTNTGNEALTGVMVHDSLLGADLSGANSTLVSSDNNTSQLDVNASWTFTYHVFATQAELDHGGTIDNTASATSVEGASGHDSVSVIIDQDPDLEIAKTVGDLIYSPDDPAGMLDDGNVHGAGDVIPYDIYVHNTGNIDLLGTNLVIDDSVADGGIVTYASGDINTNGTLDVGETWHYTAIHTITQPEMDDGANIVNTVTVHDTTDGVVFDPDDVAVGDPEVNGTTIDQMPALSLDKQVSIDGKLDTDLTKVWYDIGDQLDDPTLLGSFGTDLEYRFIVTNTGNVTLHNVTLDDVPAIVGLSDNLGDLTPGQVVTINLAGAFAPGENSDTATVLADDGTTASDTAGYYGAVPGVTLDKQVSGNGSDWVDVDNGNVAGVPVILAGGTVHFRALVGNTDARLDVTSASVSDTNPDAAFDGPGTIAAGSDPADNVYTLSTLAVADLQTDTANFSGTATDSAGHTSNWSASDSANYFGATAGVTVDKQVSVDGGVSWLDVGSAHDNPSTLVGADVQFRVVVHNTSTGGLAEDVTVGDNTLAGPFTFGSGNSLSVHLGSNGTATSNVLHSAAVLHGLTDTATANGTVTDSFGNSATPTASDTAEYNGLGLGQQLTKGYWANHPGAWHDPSGTKLVLGDLNGDGLCNDGVGGDLAFPIAVAKALLNSSTITDARIIMAGQALAAQLNDYNDGGTGAAPHGHEPLGLIEAAVKWLTTSTDPTASLTLTGGNVDTVTHNGILDSTEYTLATNGSIVFKAPALSSSSHAWHSMEKALGSGDTGNYLGIDIKADGEGLKNALMAFNQDQLVISTDGSLIGWNTGSSVIDVHHNDANVFWAILHDQHITGIS